MDSRHIMIVLIITIVMIAGIFKHRRGASIIPYVRQRWDEGAPADDAEKQRLREEVQALKERVAVLERIATDSSSNLAHEIEQLRDR